MLNQERDNKKIFTKTRLDNSLAISNEHYRQSSQRSSQLSFKPQDIAYVLDVDKDRGTLANSKPQTL